MNKFTLGALMLATSLTLTANVQAAAIHFINNDTYTTDTISGLDWLDVTTSINQPYNYVSGQFGTGGAYEGYRYATGDEFNTLVSNYTGNIITSGDYGLVQHGTDDLGGLITMLGYTYKGRDEFEFDPGVYLTHVFMVTQGITADVNPNNQSQYTARLFTEAERLRTITRNNTSQARFFEQTANSRSSIGSYLVKKQRPSERGPNPCRSGSICTCFIRLFRLTS